VQRIIRRFGGPVSPELGFGLHCGWSVEGPIGSRYKIDMSYLSPHVSVTEELESATKMYGVMLLMSGTFHSLLSDAGKSQCRLVDRVLFQSLDEPINVYTVYMCERRTAPDAEVAPPMSEPAVTTSTLLERVAGRCARVCVRVYVCVCVCVYVCVYVTVCVLPLSA
jgi:hypothetical protein